MSSPVDTLKAMLPLITPGPWRHTLWVMDETPKGSVEHALEAKDGDLEVVVATLGFYGDDQFEAKSIADAEFVAAFRNLAPEIIAILEIAAAMTSPVREAIKAPGIKADRSPDYRHLMARAMRDLRDKAEDVLK